MKDINIIFRKIQRSDYKSISKIISDTWGYEKFCTPKTARRMARLYLASCLCNQTFTCVAEKDNKPLGIIMGKNQKIKKIPFRYIIGQITSTIFMLITKEGRCVLKMFEGFDNLNKSLLKESGDCFEGELSFFVVDSNYRGYGIGKKLFEKLFQYMKSEDITSFYLYTDSTCNYGFYEHFGMNRLCEKKFKLAPYRDEEIKFFLYGCKIIKEEESNG